jgi:hypothetical protein
MTTGTNGSRIRTDGSHADRWYVYGVVPADIEIDLHDCPGIGGDTRVQLVHAGNLYALASRIDAAALDLDTPDYGELTDRIVEHDLVVRRAQSTGRSVIPLPFGLVVDHLNGVRRLMEDHSARLHEALERLEGCEEYGAHVSVPRDAAQRAVRSCARGVYEQLAGYAEDAVIEPVNAGAREERPSILSAAFLVNRDRLAGFRGTAEHLARSWEAAGFTVRLSGPWPPYDFARVTCGAAGPPGAAVLLGPLSEPEGSWATSARLLLR